MATIKINNLNASGSELFSDHESYLSDLTDDEITLTQGGSSPACVICTIGWSIVIGSAVYGYGKNKKWW
ncbi:MAG: hypothetical protein V7L11_18385 [Nostoc sp.]|uniref:hypothetical protein n=1 Tax=Nostoc sp. TaxID=1180 RepID=UPI002FFBE1BE